MAWYVNTYEHCGETWQDEWDCMCNDRCPVCNHEIEPCESIEAEEEPCTTSSDSTKTIKSA